MELELPFAAAMERAAEPFAAAIAEAARQKRKQVSASCQLRCVCVESNAEGGRCSCKHGPR